MARPPRNDCDYFPFLVKEGKTFTLLRRRWPLEGIGFFTELCIILTRTPYHHIKVESDLDFEYLISGIGCELEKARDIINLLCETGKIHKKLWTEHNILVIPDLLESLKDAYKGRSNEIVSIEEIGVYGLETRVSSLETTPEAEFLPLKTPKGKERKLKETKKDFDFSFIEDQEWRDLWELWCSSKPSPYTKKIGVEKGYAHLLNISGNDILRAKSIVDNAIAQSWKGLYAPANLNNSTQTTHSTGPTYAKLAVCRNKCTVCGKQADLRYGKCEECADEG